MGALRDAMQREMALRGLAPRTQVIYLRWIVRLAKHCRLSPADVSETQVREFLAAMAQRGLSAATVNQAISAVTFFFGRVVRRQWQFEINYQRARQRLPVVLSREEMGRLLLAVPTVRERAALELAYGAGLRLSEVLHLKVADIDGAAKVLRVEQG